MNSQRLTQTRIIQGSKLKEEHITVKCWRGIPALLLSDSLHEMCGWGLKPRMTNWGTTYKGVKILDIKVGRCEREKGLEKRKLANWSM